MVLQGHVNWFVTSDNSYSHIRQSAGLRISQPIASKPRNTNDLQLMLQNFDMRRWGESGWILGCGGRTLIDKSIYSKVLMYLWAYCKNCGVNGVITNKKGLVMFSCSPSHESTDTFILSPTPLEAVTLLSHSIVYAVSSKVGDLQWKAAMLTYVL